MAKKPTVETVHLPTKRETARYHRYSTLCQDDDERIELPAGVYSDDRPQFRAIVRFYEANLGTNLIVENISSLVRGGLLSLYEPA